MRTQIIIGILIALFVFSLSPDKFTNDSLLLAILLSAIVAVSYLIFLTRKDQEIR